MDRWARIVDHLLGEVIGDGDISDLPGARKPLPPLEDSHTPPDQRAAFKIMQDNDVVPEWVTLAKSVDDSEARIRADVDSNAKRLNEDSEDGWTGSCGRGDTKLSRYASQLDERIERHNRDVILHNLKAPRGIPRRSILNSQKLIQEALAKSRRDA